MIRINSTTPTGRIIKTVAAQIAQEAGPDDNWRTVVAQLLKPQWRQTAPEEDGIAVLEINQPGHPSIRVKAAVVKQESWYYLSDTYKSPCYEAKLNMWTYTFQDQYKLLINTVVDLKEWIVTHSMIPERRVKMSHREAEDAMSDATSRLLEIVHESAQQEREQITRRADKQINKKDKQAAEWLSAEQAARRQVGQAIPTINHMLESGQVSKSKGRINPAQP